MTTIAYRDGVLAADSLRTFSTGTRDGYACKIRRIGRLLVACSGSAAVGEAFKDWVAAGMDGQSPFSGKDEGNGLVVAPGGIVVCFGQNGPWQVLGTGFFAIGSGQEIAMGAMAHGATAPEAVKAAIQLDTNSGGEIHIGAVSHETAVK